MYREPDRICLSIKVNHPKKPSESAAGTLNSDYETVATDPVKSPNTAHALHAVPGSTPYVQVH